MFQKAGTKKYEDELSNLINVQYTLNTIDFLEERGISPLNVEVIKKETKLEDVERAKLAFDKKEEAKEALMKVYGLKESYSLSNFVKFPDEFNQEAFIFLYDELIKAGFNFDERIIIGHHEFSLSFSYSELFKRIEISVNYTEEFGSDYYEYVTNSWSTQWANLNKKYENSYHLEDMLYEVDAEHLYKSDVPKHVKRIIDVWNRIKKISQNSLAMREIELIQDLENKEVEYGKENE